MALPARFAFFQNPINQSVSYHYVWGKKLVTRHDPNL